MKRHRLRGTTVRIERVYESEIPKEKLNLRVPTGCVGGYIEIYNKEDLKRKRKIT